MRLSGVDSPQNRHCKKSPDDDDRGGGGSFVGKEERTDYQAAPWPTFDNRQGIQMIFSPIMARFILWSEFFPFLS